MLESWGIEPAMASYYSAPVPNPPIPYSPFAFDKLSKTPLGIWGIDSQQLLAQRLVSCMLDQIGGSSSAQPVNLGLRKLRCNAPTFQVHILHQRTASIVYTRMGAKRHVWSTRIQTQHAASRKLMVLAHSTHPRLPDAPRSSYKKF